MREANWDEIFQRRRDDALPQDERLSSFLPWEDWLTFAIVAIGFMSVVHSIDSADWVDDMPSLYPIGFSGLLIGYALSRIRRSELLLHPLALLGGATLVFLQLLAILPGESPAARTDVLLDRMHLWWSAVTQGGISNDSLPFIVLILTMTWLGAYVSSWAIFRWRNPWLGLVPGGTALMWNISFIPGQFSYSFVVFLFAAVLLLMRVHIANKERDWEQGGVVYPEFLSLSVLNATFWVTVGLLILVWLMPLAERSDSANERWQGFTDPVASRLAPLARVFVSVNAKKPIDVHNLQDALPFQGKITLNSRQAVELEVEITPEMAPFLRAQSFDEYTADGWKINVTGDVPLQPFERAVPESDGVARQEVTINVTVKGDNDNFLYTVGQPVLSDQRGEAGQVAAPDDLSSMKPRGDLDDGDRYTTTGSVSVATIDQLRAAGTDYPAEILSRYLQLPDDLPARVERQAIELAARAETPYDAAIAIERYLRTFPTDYRVPSTPPGRDTVDYFLFDLQRGYFDYHASAMAVMLRTLGIPSRVAVGYAIDPTYKDADPESNTYRLNEKVAFAWPEVYFPEIGWVEFNPTPSQPALNRPGTPLAPSDGGPGESPSNPTGAEDDLDIPNPDLQPEPIDGLGDESGSSSPWPVIITLAVIGVLAAVVVGGSRLAWEYGLGGLPRPAQLWEKTQRLAKWGRAGSRPSETPREFARRLRSEVPGTEPAGYLAAVYERNRFGDKQLTEDEAERLDAAWVGLRNALIRRVLRLRPRA